MTLRLSLENADRSHGGPLRIEAKERGLVLGRVQHLDWTLPDRSRIVPGKHCEIRFKAGGYWPRPVSTNGTFVNGSPYSLDAPYLLHDGDRLKIGPYIMAVSVQRGEEPGRSKGSVSSAPVASLWETLEQAEALDNHPAFQVRKRSTRLPDFFDFDAFIEPEKAPARWEPAPEQVDSWLTAPSVPPVEITTQAVPSPAPVHSRGFALPEIDRDLVQQSQYGSRRGPRPDVRLFDFATGCPVAVGAPDAGVGQLVWLTMPARADKKREVSPKPTENAACYIAGAEIVIDSASNRNFPALPLRFDGLLTTLFRLTVNRRRGRNSARREPSACASPAIDRDCGWSSGPLEKTGDDDERR